MKTGLDSFLHYVATAELTIRIYPPSSQFRASRSKCSLSRIRMPILDEHEIGTCCGPRESRASTAITSASAMTNSKRGNK